MKLILYYDNISPPVRAVLMTIEALNINVELKKVDLFKLEQREPEFLKLSPVGRVPVLQTDQDTISDSHAICCYLAETAGKSGEVLFPKDPLARARVLQMLFFDCDVAFRKSGEVMIPVFLKQIDVLTQQQIDGVLEVYKCLEQYLEKFDYLAGPQVTLADISIISSVAGMSLLIPIGENYPQLQDWFERCKQMPWYKANLEGLQRARNHLKTTAFAAQVQ